MEKPSAAERWLKHTGSVGLGLSIAVLGLIGLLWHEDPALRGPWLWAVYFVLVFAGVALHFKASNKEADRLLGECIQLQARVKILSAQRPTEIRNSEESTA